VTRAAGFRPATIEPDEHLAWLEARLASPASRLWIGLADGTPIGQLRLERDGAGVAEVGISIAPEARGRRLARPLLDAGLAAGRADPSFAPVWFLARVRPENAASLALFRGAGFVEVAQHEVNGLPCLVFRRDPAG
jgi:RimJ/RimL family protein N-acetyltransferase